MISKPTVTIDMKSLKDFREAVAADASTTQYSPIAKALKQWAARYRAFIRDRFVTYSRGGGDWAPLAPSTLARRRTGRQGTNRAGGVVKMRKGGALRDATGRFVTAVNAAILRDTGTLFAALSPTFGKPGQVEEVTQFGVQVGFGGSGMHPSGSATIADIAAFHQFGTPRMPARPILVEPDLATLDGMAEDMERALDKLAKELGNT